MTHKQFIGWNPILQAAGFMAYMSPSGTTPAFGLAILGAAIVLDEFERRALEALGRNLTFVESLRYAAPFWLAMTAAAAAGKWAAGS